jgi:MFS family permease
MVSLLNDFSSEMIFPLLPAFFTIALGGSASGLGAMEGLVDSISSLLKLVAGRISDRLPRRKPLLLLGYGLASITRPVVAFAFSPWQVLALRVLDRTGKGIRGAPRDALIADSVAPTARGRAFGFHRSMDHLGAIAGPITALILIPLMFGSRPLGPADYRLLFAIAAAPAALSLLVLLLGVKEAPRPPRANDSRAGSPRLARTFWWLLAIITLFALGNSSDAFLLLRAQRIGLSLRDLYFIWVVLHLVKSALSAPAGALSDRLGRKSLILAGWIVYSLVYAGFALATQPWQIWLLFGVYGIYFGLVEGTERALVADLVPAEARGTAFGWYNGCVGAAAFPASLLFGVLWDHGGPVAAFGLGCGLALAAAALLTAIPMPRPVRS